MDDRAIRVADAVADPAASAATDKPTLRLKGICKSYGIGTAHMTEVLHGIDLTLRRGDFAALVGPSGSGKSTLLNLIGLLDKPSAGRLFLIGREAENLNDEALTRLRGNAIGFVCSSSITCCLPLLQLKTSCCRCWLRASGRMPRCAPGQRS